jgi:tetratricopeptide (TPR) repeat protein
MREKLRPIEWDREVIEGSEKEIYSFTWSRTVTSKWWFLFIELLAVVLLLTGCENFNGRRTIWQSERLLAKREKDIEELDEMRGRLRKIIDMKVQAVELLESTNRLLGRKYMEIGSYNLAREVLIEAEFLKPNNAFIKKDLGECYYFLALSSSDGDTKDKNFTIAREYYESSLSLSPDLIEARYGLGLLLFFGFNNVSGAIGEMKQILTYEPENVEAHFALGRFYYEIDELGKSLGEYLTLTRILPRGSQKLKKAEENIIKINREMGKIETF